MQVGVQQVVSFDVGRTHVCAIDGQRVLSCFGSNANDEVGAEAAYDAPHRVAEGVTSMWVGPFFTCYRRGEADVECIGVAPPPDQRMAERVTHTSDAIASSTCSLDEGRVRCTTPGIGTLASFVVPDVDDARALEVGAEHACLRREDSSVWCWGANHDNQLGQPANDDTPAAVSNVRARQIATGAYFTCALTESGTVVCWGSNEGGAIGVDTESAMRSTPAPQTIRRVE